MMTNTMNSLHVVGEQYVGTDTWIVDPPAKIPSSLSPEWSIRYLSGGKSLSLVETLCLAEKVTGDTSFTHDAEGRPYFGPATHFLSYPWSSRYSKILEAIDAQQPGKLMRISGSTFFASHRITPMRWQKKNKDDDLDRMAEGWPIRTCQATWMVATPWHNPEGVCPHLVPQRAVLDREGKKGVRVDHAARRRRARFKNPLKTNLSRLLAFLLRLTS